MPARQRLERLVLTRPEPEVQTWLHALQAQGWPAQALPLMTIAAPTDPVLQAGLQQLRAQWWTLDALMFVSAAAVQHFFASPLPLPPAGSRLPRAWAPGPGTARVLRQALTAQGLANLPIDTPPPDAPQFDSEALWAVVAGQMRPGLRVGWVRGASPEAPPATASQADPATHAANLAGQGRDWLIRQCQAAGAVVQACAAYERRAPVLSPAQQALLQAASEPGSVWLFSNGEALSYLRQTAPKPPHWHAASALTTHARIAAAARAAGFNPVLETRPTLTDVLRTLENHWCRP